MARLTVASDAAEAVELAAARLAAAISSGRAEGRVVHLCLAGGETPRPAYERLSELVGDWHGAELWLGDERMVPRDDPDSNYRMLAETLVERSGATAHPVPTAGSAEQAAAAYGELIRERVPDGAGGMPVFDAALLGLGEDGHTASLFPSSPALQVHGEVCIAVHDAPKPPPDRVTLSLEVLRAVRRRTMLATGAAKAGAIAAVLAGPDPAVPASLLADDALELIADGDAAGGSG